MWGQRQLRQLDAQISRVLSGQGGQQRRAVAAWTAKHPTGRMTAVPSAPMPAKLAGAAREALRRDIRMRLDLPEATVVVALSGEGYPQEWWTAIWWAAELLTDDQPSVSLRDLPAGLCALAVTSARGELSVQISDSIERARQYEAAFAVLTASAQLSRRGSPMAALKSRLRKSGSVSRARVVTASAAAILLAVSVAFVITMARHPDQPVRAAVPPPTPAGTAPRSTVSPTPRRAEQSSSSATRKAKSSPTPSPSPGRTASASPSPSQSPSSPPGRGRSSPAPSSHPPPTPTPTPSKSRKCVIILGIRVCL